MVLKKVIRLAVLGALVSITQLGIAEESKKVVSKPRIKKKDDGFVLPRPSGFVLPDKIKDILMRNYENADSGRDFKDRYLTYYKNKESLKKFLILILNKEVSANQQESNDAFNHGNLAHNATMNEIGESLQEEKEFVWNW